MEIVCVLWDKGGGLVEEHVGQYGRHVGRERPRLIEGARGGTTVVDRESYIGRPNEGCAIQCAIDGDLLPFR